MNNNTSNNSYSNPDVYIIMVLYYPDQSQLSYMITLLRFHKCILVDNTPGSDLSPMFPHGCYIPLNENRGIAAAQNIGIKSAIKEGAKYVLLLDQDSEISTEFVSLMFDTYKNALSSGLNIAALGPSIINKESGIPYKVKLNNASSLYEQRELISSGTIISVDVLNDVGLLDESLFIDYVDFEWCWRALTCGYKCFITTETKIMHKVGEGYTQIGGYAIITSNPTRYYYQYRNFIWLLRRRYVPFGWKLKGVFKKIFFMFYLPFTSDNSKHELSIIKKGIKDGILHKPKQSQNND